MVAWLILHFDNNISETDSVDIFNKQSHDRGTPVFLTNLLDIHYHTCPLPYSSHTSGQQSLPVW
jgi:hypothetical protein